MTNHGTLFSPLQFRHGPPMPNRFMLAPMTNRQSNDDGTASRTEMEWLASRAAGGFGHIVTTSTSVAENGRSAVGELGIYSDAHISGLAELTRTVREAGSGCTVTVQLNHAGMRALGSGPVSCSEQVNPDARAMTVNEIDSVVDAFVDSAGRASAAGFDGIQIHAAHGYLISQFLNRELNSRIDQYGGSLENRSRLLFRIIREIRRRCPDVQLGVRLSPERYGQDFFEIRDVAAQLLADSCVDYLDMSLWNVRKEADDIAARGKPIIEHFTDLPRGTVRLGVAGKIVDPDTARFCMDAGADYVALGKVAILNGDYPSRLLHDNTFKYPSRLLHDNTFKPTWLPVTADFLRSQHVGEQFVQYLTAWPNFVSDGPTPRGASTVRSAWSNEELGLVDS